LNEEPFSNCISDELEERLGDCLTEEEKNEILEAVREKLMDKVGFCEEEEGEELPEIDINV